MINEKFNNDLVVNGRIPEKYKVNFKFVIAQLKKSGFLIEEVGFGHLFFPIFNQSYEFFFLTVFINKGV
jgi:hypothetical protein